MITLRQTLAPYDPDLARINNQNSHATITYKLCYTRANGGTLRGIFEVKFTQLLRTSLYRCIHRKNVFYLTERNSISKPVALIHIFNTCCLRIFCFA